MTTSRYAKNLKIKLEQAINLLIHYVFMNQVKVARYTTLDETYYTELKKQNKLLRKVYKMQVDIARRICCLADAMHILEKQQACVSRHASYAYELSMTAIPGITHFYMQHYGTYSLYSIRYPVTKPVRQAESLQLERVLPVNILSYAPLTRPEQMRVCSTDVRKLYLIEENSSLYLHLAEISVIHEMIVNYLVDLQSRASEVNKMFLKEFNKRLKEIGGSHGKDRS